MKYRIMQQHDLIWIEGYGQVGFFRPKLAWSALGGTIGKELPRFYIHTYKSVEEAEKQILELLAYEQESELRASSEARVIRIY